MIIALQTLIFFRESLFAAIDRLLRPYYKRLSLTFSRHGEVSDDEESEDHVFAEFDEEKGVVFYPPMYVQRYAAVSDCLMDDRWCGKLEKVVDFGYHDMSFIKYLKEVPGIKHIMGVDIESMPLRCSSDLLGCEDYSAKRENPLLVTLYQGNAADPDYRLIGCDAVVAIEMIEHMLPHDLDRLVHTIFGFIKPWVAVITTPNGDFNPLFKAMERNGLRRLDHFFEWSKEQFYDWCSNIVVRYPQYTVSCRGIGPGPSGTQHYGCCSQLALFVAKDYHKQQDLNLNSLALVAKVPNPTNVCDIIGCLDSPATLTESNMICSPNNIESYTELIFSDNKSCVTIVLSPAFSIDTMEYHDKTAQCNLDTELGKNFLMFDEEPCFDVLVPRRKMDNRVYVIEDVNSRLNCSTLQVKKFSKTTQNMLAKNKIDGLVHTREVVDDIKHLTRMLNFNKDDKEKVEGEHLWYNINWGDNAPYWNQYYKSVREYSYPFETKSEECRIMDLISDEINRLIDTQLDDEFSVDVNKVEIPIDHLMRVVQHITDDEERVRDLLEWNGYEIVDDVVVYSRLVVDTASIGSHEDDWRDETFSDWDTDVHSTSYSDGSTIMPDCHGRCLYRALDHKVRKLRSMLSADEDISAELDRVVCRLMKLALRTTRSRQAHLPMKWIQCKMLDLLNLTEKAIEKKKKYFIETYPLKAICYEEAKHEYISKIKENETANEIVRKYHHLVRSSGNTASDELQNQYHFDDDLSHKSSKEFLNQTISSELNFDDIVRSPSLVDIEPTPKYPIKSRKVFHDISETPLTRTQAWVEEDPKVIQFPKRSNHGISSGDTDHSMNNIARFKSKRNHKKHKPSSDVKDADLDTSRRNKTATKTSYDKYKAKNLDKYKKRDKTSKTRIMKNVVKKKSSYNILIKTCSKKISSGSFVNLAVRSKRNLKQILPEPTSKPIPEKFKELSCPESVLEKVIKDTEIYKRDITEVDSIDEVNLESNIASTKESLLIDIIMDDKKETIALRRTIGTDAEDEPALFEQETILGSLMNVMKAESFYDKYETENVHSQTIFIYDINEPSTSKGVRHVSMDVQCGPDTTNTFAMLSATTSFTRMPKIFNTGIKIEDSPPATQMEKKSADFGTSTKEYASDSTKPMSPGIKSVGIKIKDSDTSIKERVESSTMTQENIIPKANESANVSMGMSNNFDSATETQLLKPVSSRIKMEDSGSEFCESVGSFRKSPFHYANSSKNTSDFQIKSSVSRDVGVERKLSSKYVRPKLSCGGVHVHSYKDRQTSEDVVYQGEWQRYRPKAVIRRRAFNSVIPRKVLEVASKKSKANTKESVLAKKDLPKRVAIRKPSIKKDEAHKVDNVKTKTAPNKAIKAIKYDRNATKVANKLLTSGLLSKPNKVSFVTKKPSMSSCIKENEKQQRSCRKSYLPLYLKRKLATKNKNETIIKPTDSTKTIIETTKKRPIAKLPELFESKDETRNNLLESLEINFEPRENVSYVVFRNENDQKPAAESDKPLFSKSPVTDPYRRSSSPQSQNSSAYSSPNSIATVRARPTTKMISERRFSTSSNKSTLSNNQSESAPLKNKKFTKRAKTVKKSQEKDIDNKENIPESSKKSKESETNVKSAFMRNKSVYRAHITSECSPHNSLSRHRPQNATKSNVRIPTVPCSSGKSGATTSRLSVSKRSSPKSRSSLMSEYKNVKDSIKSDTLIPPKPEKNSEDVLTERNEGVIINIVDNSLLAEWMSSSYKSIVDSHTSNILAAMRQLVEERLDFIERLSDNTDVDSKTVVLSEEKLESVSVSASTSFHDSSSINNSFGTVIEKEENNIKEAEEINDLQHAVDNSPDMMLGKESFVSVCETRRTDTDLDLLSFKSLTSASKLSEYFLAESTLNNATGSRHSGTGVVISGSFRDIFERKNPLSNQNLAPSALAVQAFSGFSMNVEPIAGDQPDRINIIDSETGSLALEYTRQTTSEELFISGRSSDSYESCLIDEDAVVPHWLFQIISQQQSVDEEEDQEPLLPAPVPLAEPMFDVNGNVLEAGTGASAGAGDGRGIHSDHSQDSSGRGTSLSSSATSSGPDSEVILIDPTAFTAQFDLMREPIGSSMVVPVPATESPDTSFMTAEGADTSRNNDILNSSGERRERTVASMGASDVDADVSSIDTDVPDSSDN